MKRPTLILAAGMLAASTASAGTADVGSPNNPYFMTNGVVLFWTTGTRANIPDCGKGNASRFAVNGSTAAGKVQVAALLAAYSMGKKIAVWGTGDCEVWHDTETVNFFQMLD
jgi:hypothetical protein